MSNGINRYYEILGLERSASAEQIKEAYRDLAKVWHPDRFSHDLRLQQKAQEKLKEINEAYEYLRDIRFKAHTKRSYHPPQQQPANPPPKTPYGSENQTESPAASFTNKNHLLGRQWKVVLAIILFISTLAIPIIVYMSHIHRIVPDDVSRRSKYSNPFGIDVGKWIVKLDCANVGRGTPKCTTNERYDWLQSLKDDVPRFVGYYDYDKEWNFILHEIGSEPRTDVFTRIDGTFAGPFNSKQEADAWVNSHNSLPDPYLLMTVRIDRYAGLLESEERLFSESRTVTGTVKSTDYGNQAGGFILRTDTGEEIDFFVDFVSISQSLFDNLPQDNHKGKQVSVQFREIIYKRAGKVVENILPDKEILMIEYLKNPKSTQKKG